MDPFSDEEMSKFLTVTQEKTGMKLLSSTEKSNSNINKRGEHFGTTSSCITKVQALSEEKNHSLHSTGDVLTSLPVRDYKSVSSDDVSRPPPHRDKSTSERAEVFLSPYFEMRPFDS